MTPEEIVQKLEKLKLCLKNDEYNDDDYVMKLLREIYHSMANTESFRRKIFTEEIIREIKDTQEGMKELKEQMTILELKTQTRNNYKKIINEYENQIKYLMKVIYT